MEMGVAVFVRKRLSSTLFDMMHLELARQSQCSRRNVVMVRRLLASSVTILQPISIRRLQHDVTTSALLQYQVGHVQAVIIQTLQFAFRNVETGTRPNPKSVKMATQTTMTDALLSARMKLVGTSQLKM